MQGAMNQSDRAGEQAKQTQSTVQHSWQQPGKEDEHAGEHDHKSHVVDFGLPAKTQQRGNHAHRQPTQNGQDALALTRRRDRIALQPGCYLGVNLGRAINPQGGVKCIIELDHAIPGVETKTVDTAPPEKTFS